MRVPSVPDKDPLDSIVSYYSIPKLYQPRFFALQLSEATTHNKGTNNRQYDRLRAALLNPVTGISATAIAGIVLLVTVL